MNMNDGIAWLESLEEDMAETGEKGGLSMTGGKADWHTRTW